MKSNSFKLLIVFFLAFICAYMFWLMCRENENVYSRILLSITGYITTFFTLGGALALEYGDWKHSVNAKILSWFFFTLSFIQHITFAIVGIKQGLLIVFSSIILLLYILFLYNLRHTKM